MSGSDGSIGYSFFSDIKEAGRSLYFVFGDEVESEAEDRDPFSGDDESGGEFEFDEAVTILRLCSPEEPNDPLLVIVISGETGCGKTTQLPQYVLESEIESGRGAFCSIICTQPRRISAMAVAERVSTKRGEPLGDSVGYKFRLEGMKGKNAHLLFCTSGILLRRLLSDRNLNGVTHVFVDEIHERWMNEDLLPRRRDLRLILMSATLNAELFSNYFRGASTIHIPGFTYLVRSHFLEDVLEMTGYKLTSFNQIDDYGQEKLWKTQKQLIPRKRKNHE
ncbi:hypothetical protein IFM89_004173 [Coptis chinensis]|uniref:RNA helicase n=1 Tax=Coptis chinensis TaxID=261450 RepID=A0A835LEB4_9MAGN|nr:hypothetical protein IFM89_004173 [Coptis chinensis]